jgi:peptidoglycan/xylan/chitin deacetylase (PgdA/CDA1 family)
MAAPALQRFGIPATIFLPTEIIESGGEFWWDELARLVLGASAEALRLGGDEVNLGGADPRDGRWLPGRPPSTDRQRAFHQLWTMLRTRDPAALESGMNELRAQVGLHAEARASHRPMRPEEVREASSPLVEFGCHSLSHAYLPALSIDEKKREVEGSRARCAALTGVEPSSFAYPYGDFDQESESVVAQAGFACACTTQQRMVSTRDRAFALPRIHVGNWTPRQLERMLAS